ncbi:MAG: CxxC-x17-CxxC domain-containing protein [bacterium]
MGNFNRRGERSDGGFNRGFGNRDGGGKRFGGRDGDRPNKFGGRDGGRPAMHRAICSECGDSCEIPFKPTGDRPVFCSDCFGKQNSGGRSNKFSGERRERPRFNDKQMHDAICAKCGQDCQVPFRPTGDKAIFCSNCFGKNDTGSRDSRENNKGKDSGEVMEQIKMLNAKMDKLIKILTPNVPAVKNEKPEVEKNITAKEIVKKEKNKVKVASKKSSAKKKK